MHSDRKKILVNSLKSREIAIISFVLVAISFLIRFPYFFRVVLDWDESTYILMAQSFLEGHLPYTELWDNKPPFIFYFVGLFIFIFGKGVVAVRIGGTLCVALSSIFVYLITKKLWENKRVSFLAAALFIFSSSNTLSGYATLSEHMALVLLLPAIYLFFVDINPITKYFFIGLLFTSSSLVRMNLAFVSLGVGIFIFGYFLYKRDLALWFKSLLAYSSGMFLGLIIAVLPYLVTGQLDIWWTSVVVAPLSYSSSQYSMFEVIAIQTQFVIRSLLHFPHENSLTALVILSGLIGFSLVLINWSNPRNKFRVGIVFLIIVLLFTELSILLGGAFWPHYMIQLLPVLCITAASLVLLIRRKSIRLVVIIIISGTLFYTSKDALSEYKIIAEHYQISNRLSHGPAYDIASYIKENNIPESQVFLLTQHIAYWLMDTKPYDKVVTHPSNIHLPYLLDHIRDRSTSPLLEMKKLLQRAPEVIVIPHKYIHYVDPAADSLLQSELTAKYYLAKSVSEYEEKALIYRRLK